LAHGRWDALALPLPDLDRAEAANVGGVTAAASSSGRLLGLARTIGTTFPVPPERSAASSAYAIEFRSVIDPGALALVSVCLVATRRDVLTGALADLAARLGPEGPPP